jgi:hypothetical protein
MPSMLNSYLMEAYLSAFHQYLPGPNVVVAANRIHMLNYGLLLQP